MLYTYGLYQQRAKAISPLNKTNSGSCAPCWNCASMVHYDILICGE